jgi:two-component system, OmpR family, response regulator MprA
MNGMSESVTSRPAAVLVIEDERYMRDLLELGLAHNGFAVASAPDGAVALAMIDQTYPDAIVLDIMLPKIDGISLLPLIRRKTEAPVLILSALVDVHTRIDGLERGADDYLAKPFHIGELVARLRALLRRPKLAEVSVVSFEDLTLDLATRIVRRGDVTIALTAREFELLTLLARSPEQVFSRDQLLAHVWGTQRDVLPGSVETCISALRAKIDRPPFRRVIHTIRGVGYSDERADCSHGRYYVDAISGGSVRPVRPRRDTRFGTNRRKPNGRSARCNRARTLARQVR